MKVLTPARLLVGPHPKTGAPWIEIHCADGSIVVALLGPVDARAVADHIAACLDGSINGRPPSRRILEIALAGGTP